MHQQKSKNTNKDPWARLDDMLGKDAEPTGIEWFTAKELRERLGLSEATAQRRLSEMKRKGLVEMWKGGCAATKLFTCKYRLIA
jgi:predicted HTH transcriptional regulator